MDVTVDGVYGSGPGPATGWRKTSSESAVALLSPSHPETSSEKDSVTDSAATAAYRRRT